MLVYEVNLSVDAGIGEAYAAWLHEHVAAMLRLDGFLGAEIFSRRPADEGREDDGRVHWTVHYRLRDRDALETYFETHAEAMRRDGVDRFGDRFTATRRILEPWPSVEASKGSRS